LYSDCPCSFKAWGALCAHLSIDHTQTEQPGQVVSFLLCILLCRFICVIVIVNYQRVYWMYLNYKSSWCEDYGFNGLLWML